MREDLLRVAGERAGNVRERSMKRGVYRSLQRMTGNEVVLWDVVMELEFIESIVTTSGCAPVTLNMICMFYIHLNLGYCPLLHTSTVEALCSR